MPLKFCLGTEKQASVSLHLWDKMWNTLTDFLLNHIWSLTHYIESVDRWSESILKLLGTVAASARGLGLILVACAQLQKWTIVCIGLANIESSNQICKLFFVKFLEKKAGYFYATITFVSQFSSDDSNCMPQVRAFLYKLTFLLKFMGNNFTFLDFSVKLNVVTLNTQMTSGCLSNTFKAQ